MDPRRTVNRPDDAAQALAREIAHAHLIVTTEEGSKAIGCTGISFVILGVSLWAGELYGLDPRAASKLFASLGVLFDSTASDGQKRKAEKRRRAASIRLHAAVDLSMEPPEGEA